MTDLVQIAPGLYRWTAVYPKADPPSPDDWLDPVGCVAYETADGLVLIDPLVEDEHWARLDALAEKHRGRVAVLTTIHYHERSRAAVSDRYGARTETPAGVTPIEFPRFRETMFWLEEQRALVPGDRLIGDEGGGIRLPPEQWIEYIGGVTLDELRAELREKLLDLPAEMVVVSHGEPVLTGGRATIERALA
jgi:hypothetical protein